jgi:hypothetical protein
MQGTNQESQKIGFGGNEMSIRIVRVQIKSQTISERPEGLVGGY